MTCLANALDASSWAAARLGPNTGIPAARRLRADHHEVCGEGPREGRDGVRVVGVDGMGRDDAGDAGVAGRGVHLGDGRIGEEGADDGVFAATGADHENLHAPRVSASPCAAHPGIPGNPRPRT
jgi:hypothetical protein